MLNSPAVLEISELADVFALRMHALFEMMLEDEDLVEVASRLLSGQGAKDKNVSGQHPPVNDQGAV